MRFNLNGEEKIFNGDPDLQLLEYLRGAEGVHTPRVGCSGKGTCGACTVLLDNIPMLSCLISMKKVEGLSVVTADETGQMIQDIFSLSFRKEGTVICSHCVPELTLKARNFLKKNISPSYEAARRANNKNLCRCIGRDKIVISFLNAAEILRDESRMMKYKATDKFYEDNP
jgi:aerobic carbon-monoxide dehydrogenase small subunit